MRPFPGNSYLPPKTHGVVIDHAGVIFKHGFPDEATEWTLEGNVDENYKNAHDDNKTPKALYCKHCERLYHGQVQCPQCGKAPSKPPKSLFAPPPVDTANEMLVEADRNSDGVFSREEKVKHWLRCVAVAFHQKSTFSKALATYRRKYDEWPGKDFPCQAPYGRSKDKISQHYPNFGKRQSNDRPEENCA